MMKTKITRKILVFFAVTLIFSQVLVIKASADKAPYSTLTITGDKSELRRTQTAYFPHRTLIRFGDEALNNPADMCVTSDGEIYISDTGNSRIVVGDMDGNLLGIIGAGVLETPRGIFVTNDKHIYVADRDRQKIYVFDPEGNVVAEYGKPTSPLYGDALSFMPIKIVVNDAGIMFVICEGNTNGISMISPNEDGIFLGYFGANRADRSIIRVILRIIATDAQRARMVSNFPPTPDNICIDEHGLLYTVTRGDEMETLKRLNIAGRNVLEGRVDVYDDVPAAVAAGNHDNVYMVSRQGFIYEFTNEGELLFIFGGADDGTQRVGLCTLVSAIAVDTSDLLYVLDQDKNQIQIFAPTEFTELLHTAIYLYSKGRYTESKEYLSRVLEVNSMFDYANKAIGRAYYQEENYEMARLHARLAKDKTGYSDAAWELRNIWLRQNVIWIIAWGAGLIALFVIVGILDRKYKILRPLRSFRSRASDIPIVRKMMYPWYFMRHPIDGCYGIAREGQASLFAANVLLCLFTVFFIINKYLSGFLQLNIIEGRYEVMSDIGVVAVVMFSLTGCNYLVCTINDGEGTLKKLYCAFAYCLTPYVTFIPLVFILSHVLTANEQFLIDFTYALIIGWTAVLFFLSVRNVNNLMSRSTIKVLFLTVFTMLILALLVFIIYVLWSQVFEFVSALWREAVYRLGL